MGGLLRNINNFSFEFNAMINQEITILDGVGLPAGRTEKLELKPATAQLGLDWG